MKRKFFIVLILVLVFSSVCPIFSAQAAVKKKVVKKPVITSQTLIGRLAIMDSYDKKFFYIEPKTKERYFLRNQVDIDLVINNFGLIVPKKDFDKLSKHKRSKTPTTLANKYAGKIVASANATSTWYYFNPADKIAYQIESYQDFYAVGKVIGVLSPPLSALRGLKMNQKQFTYDPLFDGVAQVRYDGSHFYNNLESGRVLPLASLTKVMTALVFLDTNPNWDQVVEITPAEIKYPCTLQSCGSTSEINLKAGDRVRIADLWVAMLTASSNQSSKILVDNSGLSTEEFVARMNQKAKELGLIKTQFVEMSGLSPDNISTAEEFSKIAKLAFSNYKIAQGTSYNDYNFVAEQSDGGLREVRVINRNYSLLAFEPEAVKTGYLIEAQRNAAILKNGQVIVVLHTYSLDQRNQLVKRILEGNDLAVIQ